MKEAPKKKILVVEDEPDILELLGLAQASGQQLLRLINQLLEIARLESGAVPLNRRPTLPMSRGARCASAPA